MSKLDFEESVDGVQRAYGEHYLYTLEKTDSPAWRVRIYQTSPRLVSSTFRYTQGPALVECTVDGNAYARTIAREFEKSLERYAGGYISLRWNKARAKVDERGLVFEKKTEFWWLAYGKRHTYTIARSEVAGGWALRVDECTFENSRRYTAADAPMQTQAGLENARLAKRAAILFEQEASTSLDTCVKRARHEIGLEFRKESADAWCAGGVGTPFAYRILRVPGDAACIAIDGPGWSCHEILQSVKRAKAILGEFESRRAEYNHDVTGWAACYRDAKRSILGEPEPPEPAALEFTKTSQTPMFAAKGETFDYTVERASWTKYGKGWRLTARTRRTGMMQILDRDLPGARLAQDVACQFEALCPKLTSEEALKDAYAQARQLVTQRALADADAIGRAKADAVKKVSDIFHDVDCAMVEWQVSCRDQITAWDGIGDTPPHFGGDLARYVREASKKAKS